MTEGACGAIGVIQLSKLFREKETNEMIPRTIEEANDLSWLPEPDSRPDGLEVLAFHRGKWTHVSWSKFYCGWSLGYAQPFIQDQGRAFAPLPDKPEGADGFFDWKGPKY